MTISPLTITIISYAVVIGIAWGVLRMRVQNIGKKVDTLEKNQQNCQKGSIQRDELFLHRMEEMIDNKLKEFMNKLLEEGRIPALHNVSRFRVDGKEGKQ